MEDQSGKVAWWKILLVLILVYGAAMLLGSAVDWADRDEKLEPGFTYGEGLYEEAFDAGIIDPYGYNPVR